MAETRELKCAYAGKEALTKVVRDMTMGEALLLKPGDRVLVQTWDGKWANCTVNGKPKTWKTLPGTVRVPLKYGIREYCSAWFYTSEAESKIKLLVEV